MEKSTPAGERCIFAVLDVFNPSKSLDFRSDSCTGFNDRLGLNTSKFHNWYGDLLCRVNFF